MLTVEVRRGDILPVLRWLDAAPVFYDPSASMARRFTPNVRMVAASRVVFFQLDSEDKSELTRVKVSAKCRGVVSGQNEALIDLRSLVDAIYSLPSRKVTLCFDGAFTKVFGTNGESAPFSASMVEEVSGNDEG